MRKRGAARRQDRRGPIWAVPDVEADVPYVGRFRDWWVFIDDMSDKEFNRMFRRYCRQGGTKSCLSLVAVPAALPLPQPERSAPYGRDTHVEAMSTSEEVKCSLVVATHLTSRSVRHIPAACAAHNPRSLFDMVAGSFSCIGLARRRCGAAPEYLDDVESQATAPR